MNGSRHTPVNEETIEAMAAAWFVERAEGFNSEQAAAFERWCLADSRHAAAVERLEQTYAILGKMPLLQSRPAFRAEAEPSRSPRSRKLLQFHPIAAAAAMAAVLAAAFVIGWIRPFSALEEQLYSTAAGGYQRVTLSDSSIVELNANSQVGVRFSSAERRVTLLAGEAHFTVTPDTQRPFLVSAGEVVVRAVGTAFNVRWVEDQVEVLVTEGKVQVADRPSLAPQLGRRPDRGSPPVLTAGELARIDTGASALTARIEGAPASFIQDRLSWQSLRLVFVETPLSKVVEQFNRINRVQLVIGDRELEEHSIGGSFRADNVEAFVRLLEASGEIAVERRGPDEIILRISR